MKVLKVIFYDNPLRSKHRCKMRTENVGKLTRLELKEAINLLEMSYKHYPNAN